MGTLGQCCRRVVFLCCRPWIVIGVSDVASVAVVCHDDVDWYAGFNGDWVNLLAEDSVEALREVSDSSRKRVLVDDCMFESDRDIIMPASGPLTGNRRR